MGDTLTKRTVRGIGWTTLASISAKVVGFGSQLVFASILEPDAFGLFALASSISAAMTVLQRGGIAQVLISRPKTITRLLGAATSSSFFLGIVVSVLLLIAAPWLAVRLDEPRLTLALSLFACSVVFTSISSPAMACIQAKLRFLQLSMLEFLTSVLKAVIAIALAVNGCGAFSMIIPIPIIAAITAVAAWLCCGEKFRFELSRRKSAMILAAGLPLAIAQLILLATWHGDYIVIKCFMSTEELGIYFFAFTLATQIFALTSSNASRVLFAGLSQLAKEPERQATAFFRAARELAAFAFPISFIQILLAKPVIEILFKEEFQPMIPIIQILSLGLAFRCVGSPAGSLLQARRKFKRLLVISILYSSFFMSAVVVGTICGGIIGTAWGATLYFTLLGPVHVLVSVPSPRSSLQELWTIFSGPFFCSSVSLVTGLMVQRLMESYVHSVIIAPCCLAVFCIFYFAVANRFSPESLGLVQRRLSPLFRWIVIKVTGKYASGDHS